MSTNRPLLSVVMPLYNGSAHVAEALESLGAPGPDEVELIVVDDGSTDESPRTVAGFQERLSLTLITQQHGGNWIETTNRGMEQAQGEYVCWLHQDDRWEPDRLNVLKQLLKDRPPCWLVHPSSFIDSAGRSLGRWTLPITSRVSSVPAAEMHRRLCIQNFLAAPAPVFHRSLVERIGLPDPSLWYTPDWDYWLRLSRAADCLVSSRMLTSFRIHDASQTVRRRTRTAELREEFDQVLSRHLDPRDGQTRRIARLSAAINIALLSGNLSRQTLLPLFSSALCTPPWAWPVYFRNSRLFERVGARWRLRRQLADTRLAITRDNSSTAPCSAAAPETTTAGRPH